jgi:hypothetical protein
VETGRGGSNVLRLAENVVLLWRAAPLKFSSHLVNAASLKSDTTLDFDGSNGQKSTATTNAIYWYTGLSTVIAVNG